MKLQPMLELVIIHTDGKIYKYEDGMVFTKQNISESRLFVDEKMLDVLISSLEAHRGKLDAIKEIADAINVNQK